MKKSFNVRFTTYKGTKLSKKLSLKKRRMFKVVSKKKKLRLNFQCKRFSSYAEWIQYRIQKLKGSESESEPTSEDIVVPDFFNDIVVVVNKQTTSQTGAQSPIETQSQTQSSLATESPRPIQLETISSVSKDIVMEEDTDLIKDNTFSIFNYQNNFLESDIDFSFESKENWDWC